MKIKILSIFLLIFISNYVTAQIAYEPAKGTSERKAILDIFRTDCSNSCQFKVHHFLICENWACASVTPLMNGEEYADSRWGLFHKTGSSWKQINWTERVEVNDDFELIDIPIQNSRIAKLIVKKYPGCPMKIFPKHY